MFSPSPDHFRSLGTALTLQAIDDLNQWQRIHTIPIETDSRRHAYNAAMKAGKAALLWITGRSPAGAISFADVCEIANIDPGDAKSAVMNGLRFAAPKKEGSLSPSRFLLVETLPQA